MHVVCRIVVVGLLLTGAGACGAREQAPPPDPATTAYCDTVRRVQGEQSAPGAGQGGVAVEAAATRRRLADLVRTAPPELTREWRNVQELTERSLVFIESTRGDPRRLDRAALERLRRGAEPAQARIRTATQQRCGIDFGGPG